MTGKKHLWIPLTLMLLASIAMVNMPVNASSTVKIYIAPELPEYIPGVPVGGIVDVEVRIESPSEWDNTVNGIVGWAMNVHVDPAVLKPLTILGATSGYFLYDFIDSNFYYGHEPSLLKTVDPASGNFTDVSEMIFGWEDLGVGAGGNGTLCTLRFQSLSAAYTKIELTGVYYYTPAGKFAADIVGDGQYLTPPVYEANLVGHGAWPEHHHFDISKAGDVNVPDSHGTPGNQTLYGKVKNIGDTNVTVKVEFELMLGETPGPLVVTDEVEIAPGQITTLTANFAGFDGYPWDVGVDDGKWSFSATCWYFNGNIEDWVSGTKIKTGSFTVVP